MTRRYTVEPRKAHIFSRSLLEWYEASRRPFPWRNSSDPYYVTVCEVLLQRTNAEKVVAVARELFRRFPSAHALASAEVEEIKQLILPLGLPRRATQIRAIATAFASAERQHGRLALDELQELPGVGPYVAAAVRVIACGQLDALIDEHVLRVLRRVFSVEAPARRHPNRDLIEFARALVPTHSPKEYNLSLLDLGRLVCRPRKPKCGECPVNAICDYARSGGDAFGSLD